MNAPTLNLFIVDDDITAVKGLRKYLAARFGDNLTISTFYNGESALKMVNSDTNIVILDFNLGNEDGNQVLKAIKAINPKTEVIMLTSNEDIGIAIESFRGGATDYVLKGGQAWKKIEKQIYRILLYPINFMVKELRVSKLLAIFLLTFVTMGVAVYFIMKYVNFV